MLCRTYEDVEPWMKMKVQCVPLIHVKPDSTLTSTIPGGIEIFNYNAMKTSEIQNPLFIIHKMTIKKFTL